MEAEGRHEIARALQASALAPFRVKIRNRPGKAHAAKGRHPGWLLLLRLPRVRLSPVPPHIGQGPSETGKGARRSLSVLRPGSKSSSADTPSQAAAAGAAYPSRRCICSFALFLLLSLTACDCSCSGVRVPADEAEVAARDEPWHWVRARAALATSSDRQMRRQWRS